MWISRTKHMGQSRKGRKRYRRLFRFAHDAWSKGKHMAVYRYSHHTGALEPVATGVNTEHPGEYYDIKQGAWISPEGEQMEYQYLDRWDQGKKCWMVDVYINGKWAYVRTQERTMAMRSDPHSPLCECSTCYNKRTAKADAANPIIPAADGVPTRSWGPINAPTRHVNPRYPGDSVGHSYYTGGYLPSKLYDGVDRKKWPLTWHMLVTFSFQPDFYKDTRTAYQSYDDWKKQEAAKEAIEAKAAEAEPAESADPNTNEDIYGRY